MSRRPFPFVTAQRKHTETILEKLIENSLEYRTSAPPRIHVGYQSSAGFGRFYVRDNGIGIEPRYFSKIFPIFKRLHSYSAHPGSGVGLAICEKIVKRYGGEIWVESAAGNGSDVLVHLARRNRGAASPGIHRKRCKGELILSNRRRSPEPTRPAHSPAPPGFTLRLFVSGRPFGANLQRQDTFLATHPRATRSMRRTGEYNWY